MKPVKTHLPPIFRPEKTEKNDVLVALDVDRTITNRTTWYFACTQNNLLIPYNKIDSFRELNTNLFVEYQSDKSTTFRMKTLELIEPEKSDWFIRMQDTGVSADEIEFRPYQHLYSNTLYFAGYYTSFHLPVFPEITQYLNIAKGLYGSRLKVVFLSSGYHEFISGFIHGAIKKREIPDVEVLVKGSTLTGVGGTLKETFFFSQSEKKRCLDESISRGAFVSLYMDDSNECPEIFDSVNRNGGKGILVQHEEKKSNLTELSNLISKFDEVNIVNNLKLHNSAIAIQKYSSELPDAVRYFNAYQNKIGILRVPNAIIEKELDSLQKNEMGYDAFVAMYKKITKSNSTHTYLRSSLYYYWTPNYTSNAMVNNWTLLFTLSYDLLQLLFERTVGIQIQFSKIDFGLVVYSLIDNMLNSIVACSHGLECAELDDPPNWKKCNSLVIEKHIESIYRTFYKYLNDEDIRNDIGLLLNSLPRRAMIDAFSNFENCHKGLRELDDPIAIFIFIQHIIRLSIAKGNTYDYVVNFPYGGYEIGYAYLAYLNIFKKTVTSNCLINCHYSSKMSLRKCLPRRNGSELYKKIENFVPSHHTPKLKKLMNSSCSVLLLDNNATTFNTLNNFKSAIETKNIRVESAVVGINYKNLAKYLLGHHDCETPIPDWESFLAYRPIQEYVTAFNTWLTSEKTKIINGIYVNNQSKSDAETDVKPQIFKVCRVHNFIDYRTVKNIGANAIGIHAVEKTRNNEAEPSDFLPISQHECEDIASLYKEASDETKIFLVFETMLQIGKIKKILSRYGISGDRVTLQFQCRLDSSYINAIHNNGFSIMASIGIDQYDFSDYLDFLDISLNTHRDMILLDLSKHQPDLIEKEEIYRERTYDEKLTKLIKILEPLKRVNTTIILADDIFYEGLLSFYYFLADKGVRISGIDVQNVLENPIFKTTPYYDGSGYVVRKCRYEANRWRGLAN